MIARLSAANPLVLASGSPRRRELLALAGIPFVVDIPTISEDNSSNLDPQNYACKLSLAKAEAIAPSHPQHIVLGADTVVILGDRLYGKPLDGKDAVRMLNELAGRIHTVITAVTILFPGLPPHTRHERTRVTMRRLKQREIEEYVATGEPLDKAGAYAIQDKGSLVVKRISGDFYNVVGLPLELVRCMLVGAGVW